MTAPAATTTISSVQVVNLDAGALDLLITVALRGFHTPADTNAADQLLAASLVRTSIGGLVVEPAGEAAIADALHIGEDHSGRTDVDTGIRELAPVRRSLDHALTRWNRRRPLRAAELDALDGALLREIGGLDDQVQPILSGLSLVQPLVADIAGRLAVARTRFEAGDLSYVAGTMVDSYATSSWHLDRMLTWIGPAGDA